eukprot:TRINITY_DN3660_c0_g1_i3.p1 TRINITY_DN3660_c0_g1~~TRINITY_DN3660_c0_g1_i3.p1  ORF type:complete len:443 (+),score=87.33 TRINITY_DN3660_c0_g1_i3:550-1878(+)
MMYHGTKGDRKNLQVEMHVKSKKQTNSTKVQLPVLVTSYEVAINDRAFLRKHGWKYLVVDEAHRLKNFNCRLVKELRVLVSENRLLLTGTPLQNNLGELWALLNFILPDIFDSLDNFKSWFDFDQVLENAELEGLQKQQEREKLTSQLIQKLHTILKPFLLRRLKQDVEKLNLPRKREIVIYCPFKPLQHAFYELVRQKHLNDWRETKSQHSHMNILMSLRKVCNHPFLFDDEFDEFQERFKKSNKPIEEFLHSMVNQAKETQKRRSEDTVDTKLRKKKEIQYDEPDSNSDFDRSDSEEETQETREDSKEETKVIRGRSAFLFFCIDKRKELDKEAPGRRLEHISKTLAKHWKEMSDDKKKVYQEMAEEDAQRYQKEHLAERHRKDPNLFIKDPKKYLDMMKETCSKMEMLDRMLCNLLEKGHKVLIFFTNDQTAGHFRGLS